MDDKTPTPKSILERLRWIAPVISILVAPITIYKIATSTDPLERVLFGLGLSILVVLMLWWLAFEWRRRNMIRTRELVAEISRKELVAPLENLQSRIKHFEAEEAFRYLATVYGWGYESLDVSGTIGRDGSMRLERAVTVQARRPMERLAQSLHVQPDPIENSPHQTNVSVMPRTPGFRVLEVKPYPLPSGWVVDFSIAPSLQAGQRFSFGLVEDVPPKTFQVGVRRVGAPGPGEQFDWLSWRIDRPIRQLSLTVIFPVGYRTSGVQTRVYYQPVPKNPDAGQRHTDEETRAGQLLAQKEQDGVAVATLSIDLPVLGLIYMVAWNPLYMVAGDSPQ